MIITIILLLSSLYYYYLYVEYVPPTLCVAVLIGSCATLQGYLGGLVLMSVVARPPLVLCRSPTVTADCLFPHSTPLAYLLAHSPTLPLSHSPFLFAPRPPFSRFATGGLVWFWFGLVWERVSGVPPELCCLTILGKPLRDTLPTLYILFSIIIIGRTSLGSSPKRVGGWWV